MKPRYLVDAMLGNVARKLRMLGYDTEYSAGGASVEAAASSGRILVTKNSTLLRRATRLRAATVTGDTEYAIMRRLLRGDTPTVSGERARCTMCNGATEEVPTCEAAGRAPPGIIHTRFWECVSCGHLYWEGTHLDRVREAVRGWT
ncbi:MAG: hypothetical protein J4G04_03755 [Nitrosopumilaceae archaeon]|nr:hypothetical protein [Nitrosopumilaceae archaeon]